MNWQLLLDNALAFGAWVGFTEWEINRNASLIDQNGSQDNLKQGFHERRGWVRFWWGCSLVVVGSLWADGWASFGLSCLGLVLLLGGYFVRTFNPRLNVARASAWVGRFYVSFALDAAWWPDRWIARQAAKRYPTDPVRQREWAQQRLQLVLNLALLLGTGAWLACSHWAAKD